MKKILKVGAILGTIAGIGALVCKKSPKVRAKVAKIKEDIKSNITSVSELGCDCVDEYNCHPDCVCDCGCENCCTNLKKEKTIDEEYQKAELEKVDSFDDSELPNE